jgi:predicted AlkP superfamily phosphohydrolase/phosphomutase
MLLCEPSSGDPVFSAILPREQIYEGPHLDLAPDLILEPQREGANPAENFVLDSTLHARPTAIFTSSSPYSGNHALDGILCAWGLGVRRAHTVEGANILDLAPTILAALGCAVPKQMEGKILDIFTEPLAAPAVTDAAATGVIYQQEYSADDAEIVAQRLRDLGYL